MATLDQLTQYLNEYLKIDEISDSCPNGLQVEGKSKIRKIGTAVSANYMTIVKAIEEEVDVLIVHHGLFWERDPYPIVGAKRKKILLLLENEISLLAYHLPLDCHPKVGNNWKAAQDLGWAEIEAFGVYNGNKVGVKGRFSQTPVQAFLAEIEAYYDHPATVALAGKEMISSAALISGGAYKYISQAAKEGVDCFITGNFDEPAWSMAHEEGIHFFALGHSATERIAPRAVGEHISHFFKIPSVFLDVPNPF